MPNSEWQLFMNKKHFLENFDAAIQQQLSRLESSNIMDRIYAQDHTVWKPSPKEIVNRLGWLKSPETMIEHVPRLKQFTAEVRQAGFTRVLLLGMGGSSLAPEVFRHVFGVKPGYLDVEVLDSTDPAAVLAAERRHDPQTTLYIVASKSGGTIETFSFFKYFYKCVLKALGPERVGHHFVAITDPGSGLADTAKKFQFRDVFLNDPKIGGRYSALSFFGMLPAALLGMDVGKLLRRAKQAVDSRVGADDGVIIGTLALAGRDKLTLPDAGRLNPIGPWVEQLVAESLGKEGKGVLPVCEASGGPVEVYGPDRYFVQLSADDPSEENPEIERLQHAGHPVSKIQWSDVYDLGAEMFRWELATAVAGHILKVNPFDQPNVESAKVLARNMVGAYQAEGKLPEPAPALEQGGIKAFADVEGTTIKSLLENFFAQAEPGDYLSLQAYVHATEEVTQSLETWRTQLRDQYKLATTLGFGPRFLHSTGQLHKGDRGNGLFIQLTCDDAHDIDIPDEAGKPDSTMTFGILKASQALGDRQALLDAGRRVIRFHLGTDVVGGINQLKASWSK